MDHLDRQSGIAQRPHQRFLIAAGRLDRDARDRLVGTHAGHEGGDGIGAVLVLGGTTPMPRRLEACTPNVDADEDWIV